MKKYLLTTLLGVFAFVGFTNAGRSSDSDIYNCIITDDYDLTTNEYCVAYYYDDYGYSLQRGGKLDDLNCGNYYFGFLSNVSLSYEGITSLGDNAYYYYPFDGGDYDIIDNSFVLSSPVVSCSPLTYISSSEGDNSGGSLLPNGESDLSLIITGLNSTITEFIPYLVYLGLGIITVIIGFVAIRWLVNRTQAKIRGTFSSGRRRK